MSDRTTYFIAAAALALAIAAAAFFFWWPRHRAETAPAADVPQASVAPAAPPAPEAAASQPAIKYPIEAASAPPAGDSMLAALEALLGAKVVQGQLQTDAFAQRFVATVDNLGRPFAAARLWPVNPPSGRFSVEADKSISPNNAERYAGFVRFIDSVDAPRAVATYKQVYPQLQRAYEEQGFRGRYFNDRMVEVIDQLLATPEPAKPPKVHLTEVKGPVTSTRPWVRYEFDDPAFESLASGQKMLLRMGPEQERRLKAKLRQIRTLITQSG